MRSRVSRGGSERIRSLSRSFTPTKGNELWPRKQRPQRKRRRSPPEPASGPLKPPHGGAILRMYLIGHGDCLLIAFAGKDPDKQAAMFHSWLLDALGLVVEVGNIKPISAQDRDPNRANIEIHVK